MRRRPLGALIFIAALGVTLAGCESRLRDDPRFGDAVRQNQAAQIADPDAHYVGIPTPGSNGRRVEAAQERYVRGEVIQPPSTSTSMVSTGGGGNPGGSGGGSPAPSSGQ